VLAVHRRVSDVGGGPLSSSITLAGFLSLFPLILVGIAVLGFLSANNTDFPEKVIDQFGLTGEAARQVLDAIDTAEQSRRAASIVGFVGLLWAGLGVVGTLSQAFNATWQVRGRGWTGKLVDLAWLVGAGLLFLVSLGMGGVSGLLPGLGIVAAVVLALGLDVVIFLWMFRALTNVAVPWTDFLPGALAGAVGLEILKAVGAYYVPRTVASASALYGSIGTIFAILAWLALFSRLVVYCSAFNVVRHEQRHGTVTVEIKVPRIEGEVPLEADRGGAVTQP
jgi:membrane protein